MAFHLQDKRVAEGEDDGVRGQGGRDRSREKRCVGAAPTEGDGSVCHQLSGRLLDAVQDLLIVARPSAHVVAGTNCVTASMRVQKELPQGCPAA